MRRRFIYMCAAVCGTALIVFACDGLVPENAPSITALISYPSGDRGGVTITDADVPATASNLDLVITLGSDLSSSTVTVSASGALALIGDAGTYPLMTPAASGAEVTVHVPVTLTAPRGSAEVTVAVDGWSQTFEFLVTPVAESVAICTEAVGRTDCSKGALDGGLVAADAGFQLDDAGLVEIRALPTVGVDLRQGDRILIELTAPALGLRALSPGQTLTGAVSTRGSLALVVDGSMPSTESVTFTGGSKSGTVKVPAIVVASGLGTVSASIAGGPISIITRNAIPPTEAIYEVGYRAPHGLGAVNELTVCSTRVAGSVALQSLSDASVVLPPQASLLAGQGCPEGYLGGANFVWTGVEPVMAVAITDSLSGTVTVDVAPTIGTVSASTGVQIPSPKYVWYCQPVDGGAEAGVLYSDGGTYDGGPDRCLGLATLQLTITVERSPPPGYTGTSMYVPAVEATVSVKPPQNVTVVGTIPPTGVNGSTTAKLSVPPGEGAFPVTVTVDGYVSMVFTIL